MGKNKISKEVLKTAKEIIASKKSQEKRIKAHNKQVKQSWKNTAIKFLNKDGELKTPIINMDDWVFKVANVTSVLHQKGQFVDKLLIEYNNGYGINFIRTPATYGPDKGKYNVTVTDPDGEDNNSVLGYKKLIINNVSIKKLSKFCKTLSKIPIKED